MSTLAFIDLSSLFYPSYKMAGEDVSLVVTNVVARVHEMAGRFQHIAIGCDSPKSFRKALSPAYKAQRERDAVAVDLLRKVQARLAADGFTMWQADGFEADDVLATAASYAEAGGHDAVLITADKDLLACVTARVRVLHTSKDTFFGIAEVKEKLGVTPELVPDYLSLVGDTSDNVPGVRGIGAKHAARLLNEFMTLDNLIASWDQENEGGPLVTPPAIRAALGAAIDGGSLALSRKLIALRRDVPGINLADATKARVAKPIAPGGDDYMADTDPGDVISGPDTGKPPVVPPHDPKTGEVIEPPPPAADADPPQPAGTTALVPTVQAELLAPDDPRFSVALEPRSTREAWSVAKAAFNSRLFTNLPNAEAAWLVIMAGRGLGLSGMAALQGAHIIEGRISWHAAVIIGRVLASGKADFFKLVKSTATEATWKTHRRDDPDPEVTEFTYTIEDAKRAGLVKEATPGKKPGNWIAIPRTMLRWRGGTELARAVFPDVCANIMSAEEMDAEPGEEVA